MPQPTWSCWRAGFGLSKPFSLPIKGTQAYRKFISDLSEEIDGEKSLAKAGLVGHGGCYEWKYTRGIQKFVFAVKLLDISQD